MSLKQRLVPYWLLLGRGLLWLVLFFVVPLYFMGELSLRSGIADHRLHLRLALGELHGRALPSTTRSSSAPSSTPALATLLCAADRLPARLRDRLQGRPLARRCCCSR